MSLVSAKFLKGICEFALRNLPGAAPPDPQGGRVKSIFLIFENSQVGDLKRYPLSMSLRTDSAKNKNKWSFTGNALTFLLFGVVHSDFDSGCTRDGMFGFGAFRTNRVKGWYT